MTSTLVITMLLAIAGRSWLLHAVAARHTRLRRSGPGWWTVELRRRACVCSMPRDLQDFPQPREFRILVWRLAGCPLWWRGSVVSLPLHFDAMIDTLEAQRFDHLFSGPFRLQPPTLLPPAGAALLH